MGEEASLLREVRGRSDDGGQMMEHGKKRIKLINHNTYSSMLP